MKNTNQIACDVQTLNEIPSAMECLGSEIAMLDEQATELIGAINPIIRQVPSGAEEACGKGMTPGESGLCQQIHERANSIRNIRFMIQDVRSRVAL